MQGETMKRQRPQLRRICQRLRRHAESGVTVSIQSIYYIFILFLFFALIYDFGSVAYTASAARSVAQMAANYAAKAVDSNVFLANQEVRLNEDGARTSAENYVNVIAPGHGAPHIDLDAGSPKVVSVGPRDLVKVEGSVKARTPFLGYLFGINEIEIQVEGYAEPAFGAGAEGQ